MGPLFNTANSQPPSFQKTTWPLLFNSRRSLPLLFAATILLSPSLLSSAPYLSVLALSASLEPYTIVFGQPLPISCPPIQVHHGIGEILKNLVVIDGNSYSYSGEFDFYHNKPHGLGVLEKVDPEGRLIEKHVGNFVNGKREGNFLEYTVLEERFSQRGRMGTFPPNIEEFRSNLRSDIYHRISYISYSNNGLRDIIGIELIPGIPQ
jgi:hypothetical protein